MTPLVQVDDLRVWFETPKGYLRAVDGMSFELQQGETLGIVGESGSGKSVLSRAVMNLLAPNARVGDGSSVRFEGRDVRSLTKAEARRFWGVDIAMVFQDPMTSLTPVVKIGRQLMEPLRYHLGLDRKAAWSRATELLTRVGITDPELRMRQYPHNLSGGMRQRVMIAIALSCEPKVLIADEPTTALDVTIQQQILNLLQGIQGERQMGMMFITHDLGVVANIADRVAVVYAGQIVEQAPTRLLFHQARHPYTQALLRSIPRLAEAKGTRLTAISGRPPTIIEPPAGCRFAPRCPHAQPACLVNAPTLETGGDPLHSYACFFPVGTSKGDEALARNRQAGHTAAGLPMTIAEGVRA